MRPADAVEAVSVTDPLVCAFLRATFCAGRDWDLRAAEELIVLMANRDAERVKALVSIHSRAPAEPLPLTNEEWDAYLRRQR